jgi:hypothetical protein
MPSAKTAHRALSKTMPRVARPHSSIDLDQAKGSSARKRKERRELSDAQKMALRKVHLQLLRMCSAR